MDVLDLIFNKEIIRQGHEISHSLKKYYDKMDYLIGLDENNRPNINNIFYLYPYLFRDEFKGVEDKVFNVLCQCSVFNAEIDILNNKIIENGNADYLFEKFMLNQFMTKSLSGLFDEDSEFWGYYEKYFKQYFEAIKKNAVKCSSLDLYTPAEYKEISRGLNALWKWPVAALACLSKDTDKIESYEELLDLEAEASALYNDLVSLKVHLNKKHYSWLLNQIINNHKIEVGSDIREISKILFKYDYDGMVLKKINTLYEMALLKAGSADNYIKKIRVSQHKANILYKDFCQLKKVKIEYHSYLNTNENILNYGLENYIQNAIDLILIKKEKGYPELKDWVVFPKTLGLIADEELIEGDVLQRAVVLNALLDLKEMGYEVKEKAVRSELEYFENIWDENYRGWSCFPQLEDFFLDVDILSEIIKIYCKCSEDKLKSCIDISIDVVQKSQDSIDSKYPKWIFIEKESSRVVEDLLFSMDESGVVSEREENVKKWFQTFEASTNANFMNALIMYDRDRCEQSVKSVLKWLENLQGNDGHWQSKWYLNDYYTTSLLAKLFRSMNLNNEMVKKLVSHLLKIQSNEEIEKLNPLEIAYASLTMMELDYVIKTEEIECFLKKAMELLIGSVDEDGFWRGCNFSKINVDEKGEDILYINIYKSSVFTTSVIISTLAKILVYISSKSRKKT